MVDRISPSTKAAWEHHEDYVAALYKRLGYVVTHNVSVDGQQIDLICQNSIPGIGWTCLCIDCKHTHLEENKSVSKDDVDRFIYTFNSRSESNRWTAGIMVSNRPFSQYAKAAAAKHPNIHLKTIDDLQEEMLQVRAYLYRCVQNYEDSGRFFDFIPPYGTATSSSEAQFLEHLVKNWLGKEAAQQLCLFGDFGTGKTTFLEYLHFTLAKKYLEDSSVRIPLLIPLRKYYEAADHQEIIMQFFAQECCVSLQYSLFHEFLTTGRILLLLDGFDEMGAKSDPTIRKSNYLKLATLAEGASKILISCRPAYFLSLDETHSVFTFVNKQMGFAPPVKGGDLAEYLYKKVQDEDLKSAFARTRTALTGTEYAYINLFDKKQIRKYLGKHDSRIVEDSKGHLNAKILFRRIREIYDLEDLAQRPILLKLIVNTLPLFQKAADGTYEVEIGGSIKKVPDITPSVLYAVYTEKELEREYKKGEVRWLIEREAKSRAIAAIAFEMFRRETVALDKAALSQVVQKVFPDKEDEQAYYLTDIRTCSFLSRDSQDSVRFTHKSFMEFYAAVYMQLEMSNLGAAQQLLSMRPLSDEVAFFLGDSIASTSSALSTAEILRRLYDRLSAVESPSGTCIQNLLNVLNYARMTISSIRKAKIDLLVYRKLQLKDQLAEDVTIGILRTAKLSATKFTIDTSEIKRWESTNTRIQEFVASSLDLRAVRFWDTHIERCLFSSTTIGIETWRDSRIRNATFRDTIIVCGNGSVGSGWLPDTADFEDCILVGLDLRGPSFYSYRFSKCTLVMCRAEWDPKRVPHMKDCKGVLLAETVGKLQEGNAGISWCDPETAKKVRKRKTTRIPKWPELLIDCFETDVEKLPKGPHEIRARLRQIEVAMQLSKHLGKLAAVSFGDSRDETPFRIIRCDGNFVSWQNQETRVATEQALRKISIGVLNSNVQIRVEK